VSAAPGIEFYFPPILLGVARELQVLREGAETESYRLLPAPAPQNLEDFAGRFYSDELDTTWTFATDSRLLTYRVMNDEPISLMPIKADWFLAERGLVVRFERESGKVRRAYIQAGRVTNLLFERR
jgi:hypothetical protein